MVERADEGKITTVEVSSMGKNKAVSSELLGSANDSDSLCPPTSCSRDTIAAAKSARHGAMLVF